MQLRLLAALALCISTHAALADEKWSVTVNIDMPGMPFQIPPQTHDVCVAPGEQSRTKMIPTEDGCKTSNVRTTGNTTSLHIECPAPKKMSGDLRATWSDNSYTGEMVAKGDFDGRATTMKINYAGRKTGTCAPGQNTVAQANRMQAQFAQQQNIQANYANAMCAQVAEQMAYQAVGLDQMCPNLKGDICRKFATTSADPDGLRTVMTEHNDWQGLAAYCGMNAGMLQSTGCKTAKARNNWAAAIDLCGQDSDLEAVALRECVGMKFTSLPASDPRSAYLPLCARYADQVRAANPTAGNEGGNIISSGKKTLDNINKLRGLFGR